MISARVSFECHGQNVNMLQVVCVPFRVYGNSMWNATTAWVGDVIQRIGHVCREFLLGIKKAPQPLYFIFHLLVLLWHESVAICFALFVLRSSLHLPIILEKWAPSSKLIRKITGRKKIEKKNLKQHVLVVTHSY